MSQRRAEDVNPLLIQWLTEWRDQARLCGSKMEFVWSKALRSLRAHPEPLRSGKECKQLKGFGDKICSQIDRKFAEHFGRGGGSGAPVTSGSGSSSGTSGAGHVLGRSPPSSSSSASSSSTSSGSPSMKRLSSMMPVRKRAPTPTKTMPSPARKTSRTSSYIPAQGSSGFALLVALLRYELEYSSSKVNKLDLSEMAQRYVTSASFGSGAMAPNGYRYSAWATMKTLLNRGLVDKTDGRSPYYFLTDDGRKLAKNLATVCPQLKDFASRYLQQQTSQATQPVARFEPIPEGNDDLGEDLEVGSSTSSQPSCSSQDQQCHSTASGLFILEPGSYEIVLCVDTRERIQTNFCKDNRAAFAAALQKQDVPIEIRTLPLGDFVWVAREKPKSQPGNLVRFFSTQAVNSVMQARDVRRELVLDVIIERKQIADLASSIKDKRWSEQKFRLRNCGLRKPTYLIEYIGKHSRKMEHAGIKPEALDQAIANCQIDGFDVKRTDNFDETVRYLTFMTRWLERFYADKMIMSCANRDELAKTSAIDLRYLTFNEFAVNSTKVRTFTAREMFLKHLLQIRGMSVAKANQVVQLYPTIRALLEAYERASNQKTKEKLLADIRDPSLVSANRRFGPALSKKIATFYCA